MTKNEAESVKNPASPKSGRDEAQATFRFVDNFPTEGELPTKKLPGPEILFGWLVARSNRIMGTTS